MPFFEVRAISNSGDDAEGWVRARDVDDCNLKVRALGFYITAVWFLDPWRPKLVGPKRLNSGRLECLMLWAESALGR
jgi:hypothetical protein